MYNRIFELDLPKGQSAFLWGPRKTGKSTYLAKHFPHSRFIDFLKTDILMKYTQAPYLLREEIEALSAEQLQHPIILDEVQKVPMILNEVHWLIENTNAYFILCGSSARKLKRGAANLLGGRAWRFTFAPLCYPEIPEFDLSLALNNGLLPSHYTKKNAHRDLNAYIEDYLKEEIIEEGLTRNLPAFTKFLESLAYSHGEQINHSNIARDCGVSATTVKGYFEILIDTLLGHEIYPYRKKVARDIITSMPKFYLFDVGIVNMLSNRTISALKGPEAGQAFEHYIFMELKAYLAYKELNQKISYWRTKTGLEVDFILGQGDISIEVKITDKVEKSQLKGLIAFSEEHQPKQALVVSQDTHRRLIKLDNATDILILPWREFLDALWNDEII